MNRHLDPRQLIEAIDGTLAPAEAAHLGGCAACRAEVEALGGVLRAAAADPAPDPSPLFWDHFGARVREATSASRIESGLPWWSGWRRPVMLAAGALAVAALVVLARPGLPEPAPGGTVANGATGPAAAFDEEAWGLVVSFADGLTWEEVQRAATPRMGVADAMIDELSAEERAALVTLLKQEMGVLE